MIIITTVLAAAHSSDSKAPYSRLGRDLKEFQPKWNESDSSSTIANQSSFRKYGPQCSILDKTEQGYVSLGSFQSFTTTLTAQEKEDIIDSVLSAQMTASRMYKREIEYSEWYKTYVRALSKLGWMIDSYRFFQYTPSDSTINLTQVTLRLLALLCTKPNQLKVTKFL